MVIFWSFCSWTDTDAAQNLIAYGFNVFSNELAGSPILNSDFFESDMMASTLNNECSFENLEFSNGFESFKVFAEDVEWFPHFEPFV